MADEPPHEDEIGYAERAQAALLGMVRDVVNMVAEHGLPGEHHFYISFNTRAAGVELSDTLRAAHPEDMTIVLQNQFENLEVRDDAFSVRLRFNGTPEQLTVPFAAITKFYDPAVTFGLMFETISLPHADNAANADDPQSTDEKPTGEVISLDQFRK